MTVSARPCRPEKRWSVFLAAAVAWAAAWAPAQQPTPAPAPAAAPAAASATAVEILERANRLMQKRLYGEAIRILDADVKARGEAQSGRQLLMLGECHYMTGQNEAARSCFVKAAKLVADKKDQAIVDYRLAGLAFRLNDAAGATAMTDAFLAKFPGHPYGGKLLVNRMRSLAGRGRPAQAEIEALYARIGREFRNADATVGMEADQAMGDFYRKTGQDDKAADMYASIVQNFRKVITSLKESKRPVPAALETSHDSAAIQLAVMCIDKQQTAEAMKWLKNVKYDAGMLRKARLLLAKLSFEKGDYPAVQKHLLADGALDTVPPGPVRSDMCLLLGLAEWKSPNGNPLKVEEHLKGVAPGGKSYGLAQLTLGDLYRDKKARTLALQAYAAALPFPDYAPAALLHSASVKADAAADAGTPADAQSLYREAGELLTRLVTRYPLAPETREAGRLAERLAAHGVAVAAPGGGQDPLDVWERMATEKPGSYEAVQALLSIARATSKTVLEEKTGRRLQAPDYAACARACDRLLDPAVYSGQGYEAAVWNTLQAEALCLRAKCEIASVAPADAAGPEPRPVYLPKPDPARAMERLKLARERVDPKQLDLVKRIDVAILEAMFKSSRLETRQEAEKRFQEMADDYGDDPAFQALGIELAEWCRENGRYADAGRHYAGVADRGRNLSENDLLRVRYTAGMLFSKAASEARRQRQDTRYVIYIYPREEISAADDIAKTYAPLKMPVTMRWPIGDITAEDALRALSQTAKLPFIWATNAPHNPVDQYLKQKRVNLEDGPTTVPRVLLLLLDPQHHRLAFDIGLVEGAPTLAPPKEDPEDPDEAGQPRKTIEIYDVRHAAARYPPLTRNYGPWKTVHGDKPQILYSILRRIEEVSGTRVIWAEGLDKEEKQAAEFKGIPNTEVNADTSCATALAAVLEPLGLRHKIVPRAPSADDYDAAKEQFAKIRQINPRSRWAEKAMGQWWLNYYDQQEYAKMKVVLREYLKVFDSAAYEHYRNACFWEGWTWEYEKNYGEACRCYARAAEERLVVIRPERAPTPAALRQQLSYDTLFAISAPVSGVFTNHSVADAIEFVRVNTRVELRAEPGLPGLEAPFNPGAFASRPALDLLGDALASAGLGFRVENLDPELAEKAYFRMMICYRKDQLMPQALENARRLLERYPQTRRKQDTYQAMLDIYKGLKDYGNVLAVLDELARTAGDSIEKFKFDYEKGSIFFDMADYARAAEIFKTVLGQANGRERVYAREAYARSLMRLGKAAEALAQFQTLLQEERDPLRRFIDQVLVFCLQLELGQAGEKDFPEDWTRYARQFSQASDEDREQLGAVETTRVMWIYFAQALLDLRQGRLADAREKLNAVTTAPDDFLAADAGYRLGMLYLDAQDYPQAREAFEYLLVFTQSAESAVRATYALGRCLEAMGNHPAAAAKYAQLVERYPLSPFVAQVSTNPVTRQAQPAPAPKAP